MYGGIFTEPLAIISTAGVTFDYITTSYDWVIMIQPDHILELQVLMMDFPTDPDACTYNYLKVNVVLSPLRTYVWSLYIHV